MFGVGLSSGECPQEVAKREREAVESLNAIAECFSSISSALQLSQGIHNSMDTRQAGANRYIYTDIVLSNFIFSKPIESIKICISMASLRHQRASIRL